MKHISLFFSDLLSVGYNTDAHIMEIQFKDGSLRQYRNVSSTVYFSLINAYSHDTYYEKYIKPIFDFISISPTAS